MSTFRVGQTVAIPCDIQPGPFPDEFLVTFETDSESISGFVQADALEKIERDKGLLPGVIQEVSGDTLVVWVRGSFFTTNGLAYFSRFNSAVEARSFA